MKAKLILITMVLLLCTFLQAQTYELTVTKGVYENLEESTSVTNGMFWDDDFFVFPVGFTFELFDSSFDTLYTDAVLYDKDVSTTMDSIFTLLTPLGLDLIDRGYASGESQSNISYLTEGKEGERIFKLEWANAGFYGDEYNEFSSYINVQLWLFESTGNVEIRFGDNQVIDSEAVFEGAQGPIVGFIDQFNNLNASFEEFIILTGEATNPNIMLLEFFDDYSNYSLIGLPTPGTIYRLSRVGVSAKETQSSSDEFSIHPNPSTSAISLKSDNNFEKIQSVSIYNNSGSLMKVVSTGFSDIDVSELVPGVYNLQIRTQEGLAVKRFVKVD